MARTHDAAVIDSLMTSVSEDMSGREIAWIPRIPIKYFRLRISVEVWVTNLDSG
jgi:hypothetical protein